MSARSSHWVGEMLKPTFLAAAVVVVAGAMAFSRAGAPWEEPQRPEFQRMANRLFAGEEPNMGRAGVEVLRQEIAEGVHDRVEHARYRTRLCWELTRLGELDEAIEIIDGVIAEIHANAELKVLVPDAVGARGVCYLRRAEIANCILRHNAACCVFPLQGAGIHIDQEPAAEAEKCFLEVLAVNPADLRWRWLLNIVHMAQGDYPDGVPQEFLIEPSAFESEAPAPRFVDVAPQLGVATFDLAGGAMVEDFSGDGLLDIVVSTIDPSGPMHYYRNRGDGGFDDISSASRIDDQLGGLNCQPADYDNDGDVDILLFRGGWMLAHGRMRNSLLRNNGDDTFSDVTRAAGMAEPAYPTQTGVWADFDNDGWLDLYIGNESSVELIGKLDFPCQLFHNNRDGTFTDIASAAGVTNNRYAKSVAAGDYDNDGDADIYVSNLGPNRLYRNNGDMTFTDVAPELNLVEPSVRSFPCWFFDYDNDGWLDIFVADYSSKLTDVAADYLNLPHEGGSPCLYHNNGDGTFTNVAQQFGLNHPYLAMGGNFGDIDNDGWLDIYLGTGNPDLTTLVPNVMLRNDAGQRYHNVTTAAGVGHLQKGHGVAFADIDNDGDQDLYHQLGAFYPTDKFSNALFLNPGTEGMRFITLKLRGVKTNRMAYGARIRVDLQTPHGPRQLHRAVGSVGSFGCSPSRQEIGLGAASAITRIEVTWPISGLRQVFKDVPMDSAFFITEGVDQLEPMPYQRIELAVE